ncbi:hypothetical protein EJ02DRAFT_150271 [Clathrospora elynae]|uniref:Uncharacterized protein n=1 Tax=Clathrospora elynae TaxID=706981 RepID=A0A6A5S6H5_9PLEO|nr:hypothetical protein EJ02DRAFT_150271 [Clathrospora elynae]
MSSSETIGSDDEAKVSRRSAQKTTSWKRRHISVCCHWAFRGHRRGRPGSAVKTDRCLQRYRRKIRHNRGPRQSLSTFLAWDPAQVLQGPGRMKTPPREQEGRHRTPVDGNRSPDLEARAPPSRRNRSCYGHPHALQSSPYCQIRYAKHRQAKAQPEARRVV